MAVALPLIPKLSTKHYTVSLPTELGKRLMSPIKGQGGWQSLTKDIQQHVEVTEQPVGIDVTYTLELPEGLMHRMIPYAVKFGSGGYQGMIRWILCLVLEQHRVDILGEPIVLKGKG